MTSCMKILPTPPDSQFCERIVASKSEFSFVDGHSQTSFVTHQMMACSKKSQARVDSQYVAGWTPAMIWTCLALLSRSRIGPIKKLPRKMSQPTGSWNIKKNLFNNLRSL